MVIAMAPPAASGDTVRALEALLKEARAGKVVGLAWIALKPGGSFEVDVVGEAHHAPVLLRGCISVLYDKAGQLIEAH